MAKPLSPTLVIAEAALLKARGKVRGKITKAIREQNTDHASEKSQKLKQAALVFSVTRLAARSVPGAILVGGGMLAKHLLAKRQANAKDSVKQDGSEN